MRLSIKRAAIVRQPSYFNLGARCESFLIGGVAGLNDEVIRPGHAQARAENIAHVNKFENLAFQRVRVRREAALVHFHPLGTDGNSGAIPHGRDVYRTRVNLVTAVQLHNAAIA